MLFGLTAPFAAALMERFGIRRVVSCALVLVALGSGLTVFMTASWQLILCWGVLVGLGTGSMALVFVATVTGRWFVKHRGLVTGVLTAGGATGQLIFLPLLATLATPHGWRTAALTVTGARAGGGAAGAAAPARPPGRRRADRLRRPGRHRGDRAGPGADRQPPAARSACCARPRSTGAFWLLAGGFAICGATTNGLVGTHFIPAAHDHGMPETTAASLLALVGVFDIVGTIASGWLTDRYDPRVLLGGYYALRGLSLLVLPGAVRGHRAPEHAGLHHLLRAGLGGHGAADDRLCRKHFGADGPVVFGWVFASHQFGAAIAATAAGLVRDRPATTTRPGHRRGACLLAAALLWYAARRSVRLRLRIPPTAGPSRDPPDRVRT